MAATASPARIDASSYDEFVRLHRERFADFLRGKLGRAAEGRGGRIGVEDTLQMALLRIYEEWPSLVEQADDERDRRLYRHLRDAAGQALRKEHGRLGSRPTIVSVDFEALQASSDDLPARQRELVARALGQMVSDLADAGDAREHRAMLDRGVLVGGLSALKNHEAVVLIAVDHLDWDQQKLADHLGVSFTSLRQTLHDARKIFYSLVSHAVGIELEDEERGRLAAYMAGELKGPELRRARRHVKHCERCQAMQREQRVFGRDAVGVLSPLPFVAGVSALARRSGVRVAIAGGGSGGGALLAQPGAAKALAVVVVTLGVGSGTAALLAGSDEHTLHLRGHAAGDAATPLTEPASAFPSLPRTTARKTSRPSASRTTTRSRRRHRTQKSNHTNRNATTNNTNSNVPAQSAATQQTTPPASGSATAGAGSAASTNTHRSSGSSEFFGQP